MKQQLYIGLVVLTFWGCQSPSAKPITEDPQQIPQTVSQFERISPHYTEGTSLLMNRPGKPNVAVADFLARLWKVYGKPDHVNFEGFDYSFRHKKTGLVFTAYCAGSGPAYGGNPADEAKLMPLLKTFDHMLDSTGFADCEIEFDTDFGRCHAGCKNGTLFETYEEL